MAYVSMQHADQFGMTWALFRSFPPLIVAMPIVDRLTRNHPVFDEQGRIRMTRLLVVTAAASAVWAILSYVLLGLMSRHHGGPPVVLTGMELVGYYLGNYVGCLTFVPLVPMIELSLRKGRLFERLHLAARDAALWESLLLVLSTVVILVCVNYMIWGGTFHVFGRADKDNLQAVCRIAMFVPIAWLAFRYGWQPVALGCSLAIGSIAITMQSLPDPSVFQTEAIVGFVATVLLIVGSRVTVYDEKTARNLSDAHRAVSLAEQERRLSELRHTQAVMALHEMSRGIAIAHGDEAGNGGAWMAAAVRQVDPQRARAARHQFYELAQKLAVDLRPEMELVAALRSVLGRTIVEAGITLVVKVARGRFGRLADELDLTAYRLAREAVAMLASNPECTGITTVWRGGSRDGLRWIFVRVDADLVKRKVTTRDADEAAKRRCLTALLGASGLGISEMREFAKSYRGSVRTKRFNSKSSVRILIAEPVERGSGITAACSDYGLLTSSPARERSLVGCD
jgi:glucose-6-phosphate-specific signal transduction histidine kinase